jgi:tripartite-type tricarboxylate transporter receptor subunit TctC
MVLSASSGAQVGRSVVSHFREGPMKLARRRFLHLAAGAAALPGLSRIAEAQAYPVRPVRIVVGFAAGGGSDLIARVMGQWLSERLGQQFVIENRTGAGTTIATETVVRAPPDGYTLLLLNSSVTVSAIFYDRLKFNVIRDIAPVASLSREAIVMVVSPSVPTRTVPEFIAYAKANPGKINMGSPGNGTVAHLAGELFKMMTGVNLVHVPYRGGASALTDMLGGQVQVMFPALSSTIEYIRSGKLRVLGIAASTRSDALPGIPTVAEFVPGYEASGLTGVGAPQDTPAEIIDKLNKEVNAGLSDPRMKARVTEFGYTVFASSPADFGTFIAAYTEKWAKVIKLTGAKVY